MKGNEKFAIFVKVWGLQIQIDIFRRKIRANHYPWRVQSLKWRFQPRYTGLYKDWPPSRHFLDRVGLWNKLPSVVQPSYPSDWNCSQLNWLEGESRKRKYTSDSQIIKRRIHLLKAKRLLTVTPILVSRVGWTVHSTRTVLNWWSSIGLGHLGVYDFLHERLFEKLILSRLKDEAKNISSKIQDSNHYK